MSHAEISIIVPVYNTERYLPECLESLLGQTLSDLEIICVDDGSTDGSAELLDRYAERDARVHVIHQENQGVSHSRNVALDHASGEYLLFVDSDDWIDLHSCQKLLNLARRDEADIVVFGGRTHPSVEWIDRCFDTADETRRGTSAGITALLSCTGSIPLMCNKLYRRDLIEKRHLRFNEELVLGEDNAFQFCCFPYAKTVTYCHDALYHYRTDRDGSALDRFYVDSAERLKKHLSVVRYVFEQWAEAGWLSTRKQDALGWASTFFAQDVAMLGFKEHERFAKTFGELISSYGLADAERDLKPYPLRCYHQIVDQPAGTDPVATIMITRPPQGEDEARNVALLAGQTLRDIELLLVGSSDAFDVLADDPRAHVAGTYQQALKAARGSWLLIADPKDRYDFDMLGGIFDQARTAGADADLIAFRDKAGLLRTQDESRLLQSLSNDGTSAGSADGRIWLTPGDLGRDLWSFSSLSLANKLWRTSFAQHESVDASSHASVALALADARAICILPVHPVACGQYPTNLLDDSVPSHGGSLDGMDAARSFASDFHHLKDEAQIRAQAGVSACGTSLLQWAGAYTTTMLEQAEALPTAEGRADFLATCARVLSQDDAVCMADRWSFPYEHDYEAVQALVGNASDPKAAYEETLEGKERAARRGIATLEDRLVQADRRNHEIRQSKSFVIGNKIVNVVKAIRGRLP